MSIQSNLVSRGVLAIRMAASLAALVGAGRPALAQTQDATIVLAELFGPKSGFALETDDASVLSKAGCLEMLTRIDFDGSIKPGLATSWTQTAPTMWDFKLRPGVKFGDGTPLTAAWAATALTHTLKVAAPARAFSPKVVLEVTAPDDQTVRVTTPTPSVLVPLRMASVNTGILSPKAFAGDRINPVGACTGPFDVVEEVPRQMLRLQRNPTYWGGPVGYAKAELRYVPDGQVRATMVQTGEAQIATVLPVSVLRQAVRGVTVVTTPLPRTTSLYLNGSRPPFDDLRVRQAFQLAVDTSAISETIYEGLAKPAVGPFAPVEPWGDPAARAIPQDVAKAQSALTAAGIKPGSLKMEIWSYVERPELADLASVLQAELGEIGVEVTVKTVSYSALEPDLLAGRFSGMLLSRSHLTDVADPGAFLVSDYSCKGSYNLSHFCQPALDAEVDAAVATVDPTERFARYRHIGDELEQQAASVFLIHDQQRDAVSTGVRGFRTHPLGHNILTKDLAPTR